MAVQIQFRRGTADEWNSANPTLASGEIGFITDTGQFKIGNGTTKWNGANNDGVNALPLQNLPATTMDKAIYSAKGAITAASAAGVPVTVTVGANNTVLVADSAQTAGIKWASTLSGLTLTSPTLNTPTVTSPAITGTTTIGAGATLTSPTINTGTLSSPTISGGTATGSVITAPKETWSVSATAATGTVVVDVITSTNWYYTTNASANWTFNFRGNVGTTMNTHLAVGQSITVGFLVTNGATAFYPTAFQIDGTAVTPKWQGAVAPTAGGVNGIDAYLFTIVKTAATPTYTVFASQTKFA